MSSVNPRSSYVLWTLIDQVFVSGGNFLLVVICARSLSLEEQGQLSLILSMYFANLIINVGLIFQGASVLAVSSSSFILRHYFGSLSVMQFLVGIVTALLCVFLWHVFFLLDVSEHGLNQIYLLFCFLLFQQVVDFSRRVAYVFETPQLSCYISAITYIPRTLILYFFIISDLNFVLCILIFTCLPIVAYASYKMKKAIVGLGFNSMKKILNEHISFVRNLAITSPFSWLWSNIPLYVLSAFNGTGSVAILASIRNITNVANPVIEMMEVFLSARMPHILKERGNVYVRKKLIVMSLIIIVMWLFGVINIVNYGPNILLYILGSKYQEYREVLMISWSFVGVYSLWRLWAVYVRSLGATFIELTTAVSGVIVAALGSIPLIIVYGVNGAAFIYVMIALFASVIQWKSLERFHLHEK